MKKMKANLALLVWGLISMAIATVVAFSTQSTYQAVNNEKEMMSKGMRSLTLAAQVQGGSDSLTYSVWRFIATGDTTYAENYLYEVNIAKSRDAAIEKLRQEGLSEDELFPALEAKRVSDELMQKELWAMRLTYSANHERTVPEDIGQVKLTQSEMALPDQEKLNLASQFVFGSEYQQMKQIISENIQGFYSALEANVSQNISEAALKIEESMHIQRIVQAVLLAWFLLLLLMMYKLLIAPALQYSRTMERQGRNIKECALTPAGSYEMCHLAETYNRLRKELQQSNAVLERQNEELLRLSKTDYLTKASTRLAVESYLSYLLETPNENPVRFAVVMLDIDDFKKFNDAYGHPAGDEALRTLAGILKESVKPFEGMAARIGGEEFMVVLPNADESTTSRYASELLASIKAARIDLEAGGTARISASIGGYVYHGENETIKDIYEYADRAMYHAKANGKACYVTYHNVCNTA